MFRRYKEIFYGLVFGFGAAIIDTLMDARQEGLSFAGEMAQHPVMIFYRICFVLFGLLLGWLLWRDSKRVRDFRELSETMAQLRQQLGKNAFLMQTKLQLLLTRDDLHIPQEAQELIRLVYQSSQELQGALRDTPLSES